MCKHPFDSNAADDVILRQIFHMPTMGIEPYTALQRQCLDGWVKREVELRPRELTLKKAMHSDVRVQMDGKPLLVKSAHGSAELVVDCRCRPLE